MNPNPAALPKTPGTSKQSLDGPTRTEPPELIALKRQLCAILDCKQERADEEAKGRHAADHPEAPWTRKCSQGTVSKTCSDTAVRGAYDVFGRDNWHSAATSPYGVSRYRYPQNALASISSPDRQLRRARNWALRFATASSE